MTLSSIVHATIVAAGPLWRLRLVVGEAHFFVDASREEPVAEFGVRVKAVAAMGVRIRHATMRANLTLCSL